MEIELRLYASFKSHLPENSSGESCVVEVGEGTTIRELRERMDIPAMAPKVIFLNGVHAQGDEVLKEGDRLGAFSPGAGG